VIPAETRRHICVLNCRLESLVFETEDQSELQLPGAELICLGMPKKKFARLPTCSYRIRDRYVRYISGRKANGRRDLIQSWIWESLNDMTGQLLAGAFD
jgi:hypothetical protein